MSSTKKINLFLFSLLAIVGAASIALASTSENISGWAQSANIGWIKLNNCDSAGTCEGGAPYGLNTTVPIIKTGVSTISGYAWSSNIGWINFADATCPTNSCTPGSQIDWASGTVSGWARACSVYMNGCSGALLSDTYRGGWDGYIALGPTRGGSWGVNIDTNTGMISGYGWGSDVVGWVSFSGNIQMPPIVPMCPDNTTPIPTRGGCPCPNNTTYDPTNNTCRNNPNCSGGQVYQPLTNSCMCPTGTILQGGQCLPPPICTGGVIVGVSCVCPVGTNINTTGNACIPIVCPFGTKLQGSICIATTCGTRQIIDPSDPSGNTCICSDGTPIPTVGPNTGTCPRKTPNYIET